jgi:hypothetical protein
MDKSLRALDLTEEEEVQLDKEVKVIAAMHERIRAEANNSDRLCPLDDPRRVAKRLKEDAERSKWPLRTD